MSSEDYKKIEKINKFNFSFDMVTKSKDDIRKQRDAVKERIDKIVNHFTIDDVPILSYILLNCLPSPNITTVMASIANASHNLYLL